MSTNEDVATVTPTWEEEEKLFELACLTCMYDKDDKCTRAKDPTKRLYRREGEYCDHWIHKEAWKYFPNAGEIDTEDIYNDHTGEENWNLAVVCCPKCKARRFPFRARKIKPTLLQSGWRWVGIDHQEPYWDYKSTCKCGTEFKFTVFCPQ